MKANQKIECRIIRFTSPITLMGFRVKPGMAGLVVNDRIVAVGSVGTDWGYIVTPTGSPRVSLSAVEGMSPLGNFIRLKSAPCRYTDEDGDVLYGTQLEELWQMGGI